MTTIKFWLRNIRSNLKRLVFAGQSRDQEYWEISMFKLSIRWWQKRTPRLDVILWWPKVRVIKGKV